MSARIAVAAIFLGSCAICLVLALPLWMESFDVGSYLRAVGTLYAPPLGAIFASLFGAGAQFPTLNRGKTTLAILAVFLWNCWPIGVAAYGLAGNHAVLFRNADLFNAMVAHLTESTIPVNAAIAAILASLFPKQAAAIPAAQPAGDGVRAVRHRNRPRSARARGRSKSPPGRA